MLKFIAFFFGIFNCDWNSCPSELRKKIDFDMPYREREEEDFDYFDKH